MQPFLNIFKTRIKDILFKTGIRDWKIQQRRDILLHLQISSISIIWML